MEKIDKVIEYFRNIKEEAPVVSSSQPILPTNNISGEGMAMFDPVINFLKRKRKRKNGEFDNRSIPKNYRKWVSNK